MEKGFLHEECCRGDSKRQKYLAFLSLPCHAVSEVLLPHVMRLLFSFYHHKTSVPIVLVKTSPVLQLYPVHIRIYSRIIRRIWSYINKTYPKWNAERRKWKTHTRTSKSFEAISNYHMHDWHHTHTQKKKEWKGAE